MPQQRRTRPASSVIPRCPMHVNFTVVMDFRPMSERLADPRTRQGPPSYNNPEDMLSAFVAQHITNWADESVQPMDAVELPRNPPGSEYVYGEAASIALAEQDQDFPIVPAVAPMSLDDIHALNGTTISQTQVQEQLRCSVCYEDFCMNDEVKQLECNHVFHVPCIIPWLEKSSTCPYCRKQLSVVTA